MELMKFASSVLVMFLFFTISESVAQVNSVEGYIFESGNRGYLNNVTVSALDRGNEVASTLTDASGFFSLVVPGNNTYVMEVSKQYFYPKLDTIFVKDQKTFLKYELKREPGYVFEITLAEARNSEDVVVDQIKGALIEVYNNTSKESVLVLDDYQDHEFKVNLQKGNHYTILIRKKGYLAKRMEAFVNVNGCLLCFEGIGRVDPGITDNLTENNQNGVLLANVELDSLFRGKKLQINNLYYDLGKWDIKPEAEDELVKVITMMNDNPHLKIELGSHTDSRGTSESNLDLSKKRARSAVNYLRSRGQIPNWRINYKGYGEEELVNACADGVKCEEDEHARNRRTELKIVGIEEETGPRKSLATMKQEEFMDELLAEIESQGVIKVTKDGMEKVEMPESKPIVEQKVVEAQDTEETEVIDDTGMENYRKGVDEVKVDKLEFNDYVEVHEDGFKIVIKESETPLSPDDMLWKKHNKLEVTFDGKQFLYSIGKFETKNDANEFFNTAKLEYPTAYLVEYRDGLKVN